MATNKNSTMPGFEQRMMVGNIGGGVRTQVFADGNSAESISLGVHIPVLDKAGNQQVDPATGYTRTNTAWVQVRPTTGCVITDKDGVVLKLADIPKGAKVEASGGYDEKQVVKNGNTYTNRVLRASVIKVQFYPRQAEWSDGADEA